jgi:hypothetical protein
MTETYRAQLVHTLRKVFRPLVRVLFGGGVRFDEFSELLRGIYVEIAIQDGAKSDLKVTPAKISILTGVARRDVDRLVSTDDWLRIPKPTDLLALGAVLHRWHTDSAFLGPYGVPLELPLSGNGGRNFADLVNGCPIPIAPDSALEQLLAAGVISRSGDSYVKVLSRSYVVRELFPAEMLEHFASAMTRLASTLKHNMISSAGSKRLEKTVFPDQGLPVELQAEFDGYVRERVHSMLSDIDDWLAAAERRDLKDPSNRAVTGVSVFQYLSPEETQIDLERHVSRDQENGLNPKRNEP